MDYTLRECRASGTTLDAPALSTRSGAPDIPSSLQRHRHIASCPYVRPPHLVPQPHVDGQARSAAVLSSPSVVQAFAVREQDHLQMLAGSVERLQDIADTFRGRLRDQNVAESVYVLQIPNSRLEAQAKVHLLVVPKVATACSRITARPGHAIWSSTRASVTCELCIRTFSLQ